MGMFDRLSETIRRGTETYGDRIERERSEFRESMDKEKETFEKTLNDLRAAQIMAETYKGERDDLVQENLTRLELSMEELGWRRFAAIQKREFTRAGLADIIELSRAMYLSNPLINRAINVTTYYTWAQGCLMKSGDEQIQKEIVEPMLRDEYNKAELYSHSARLMTDAEQMVEGNVFVILFTDLEGNVRLRSCPTEQIWEIHHREGDERYVLFYRRWYAETVFDPKSGESRLIQKQVLHPDWRYQPRSRPETVGGVEVLWDAPIIHLKSGGLKSMLFGVPETYAAMDWARAYKKFLENWHSMIASLSKYSWMITTKGSKVKETAGKLRSTIPEDPEEVERNTMTAGGAWVQKPGDEITPIPKNSATTSADDARSSRLMVASAMNMPDTILSGDVDIGNFATSKTLDRPTELFMRSRQQFWADFHSGIFNYAVGAKIRAGRLRGQVIWEPDGFNSRTFYTADRDGDGDADIEVSFPPILEQDMGNVVRAIVAAKTLEGKEPSDLIPDDVAARKMLEAIGVEDVEEALNGISQSEKKELVEKVDEINRAFKEMQEQMA